MNYLDSASLVMIPSGYKEDKVFCQLPEDGSGDLTFTRASDGTRVNSEGYIERVPLNLFTYSNIFSNSSWSKQAVTVTSGATGYDGSSDAWGLIPTTTNTNSHRIYKDYTSGGGVFTLYIYAKANGYDFLRITNYSGEAIADVSTGNPTSGTIVAQSGTPIEANIENVGNGWYKIYVVKDSLFGNLRSQIAVLSNASGSSFAGDGIKGILIQNAQLNEGPTAKPYIATTNRQDVPRLDYSNGCPCLLLEPQRTNTMLNSDNLNSWLKIDTSVTSNSTTSPDGTQNADTVTATGLGSTSHLIYQNLPFTSGTAHTLSVFAKANTSNFIQLIFPGNLIANSYANFDLVNGTITASANLTPKIESMGDGWYRCSISATAFSSSTNSQIVYLINSATASRGQAFTANGESVYLWGGQFEQSSYATSYIPTTSAAVTRLADSLALNSLPSFDNNTEFSLYLDLTRTAVDTGQIGYHYFFYSIFPTAFNFWLHVDAPVAQIRFRDALNSNATMSTIPFDANETKKIVIKSDGTNFKTFADGTLISTYAMPTAFKLQYFTFAAKTFNLNKFLSFPTALTDAQCVELTTL